MDTKNERLLTVKELAERLRISQSKAYELCASGEMPHYKVGGSIRIGEEQINEYLQSSTIVSKSRTAHLKPLRNLTLD